ncbi:hypothetical protein QN277_025372 [Acacia crassicarpa]|uniref:Retrotransposon Copia-like N-terminal domain-containing protein n=1 Tax=Acacia crassicarpa TaxID=499986 RepID=A0AAE1MKH1_9FABA|nr:hypothetical protein QN277_025372 [Acacia crassicarpa]
MADKSSSSSSNKSSSSSSTVETSTLLTAAATLSKSPSNNLNQPCSIKLDGTNYLAWQFHVLPIIKGNKLEGFLHGTKPCPPQFITENDKTSINPAFED